MKTLLLIRKSFKLSILLETSQEIMEGAALIFLLSSLMMTVRTRATIVFTLSLLISKIIQMEQKKATKFKFLSAATRPVLLKLETFETTKMQVS